MSSIPSILKLFDNNFKQFKVNDCVEIRRNSMSHPILGKIQPILVSCTIAYFRIVTHRKKARTWGRLFTLQKKLRINRKRKSISEA